MPAEFCRSIFDSFPDVAVTVERLVVGGRDQSGLPIETWKVIYSNLRCLVDPHTTGEQVEFEQREIGRDRVLLYFPCLTLATPGVPDIRPRDRINLGTWPDGTTEYVDVQSSIDELRMGVMLVVTGTSKRPG
jgi:hypothetical protein